MLHNLKVTPGLTALRTFKTGIMLWHVMYCVYPTAADCTVSVLTSAQTNVNIKVYYFSFQLVKIPLV